MQKHYSVTTRPSIWVLKGLRQGDTAQAMALALELGGRVEGKQLRFNAMHALPNFILGAGVRHLTPEATSVLRPPWPDLVVATGRRTAAVAVWIKQQSGGQSKLLQIGRPRMDLSRFDVVVTTPQYGLPSAPNVVTLALPFAIPKTVASEDIEHFSQTWQHLPRPWILAVIGGAKFPLRLNRADLANYGKRLSDLASSLGGSVVVLSSPRSPSGAVETVAAHVTAPHWAPAGTQGPNPYQPALTLCDQLVVTSDSVSMVSEMLHTQKPVWVYRLKVSPLAVSWSAQSGLAAHLARRGILHPPRNVDDFIRGLMEKNLVTELGTAQQPAQNFSVQKDHADVVWRITQLLMA